MELRMLHFQAHERLPMNQNNASENIDFEKKKKKFSSEIDQTFDNSNFYKYLPLLTRISR